MEKYPLLVSLILSTLFSNNLIAHETLCIEEDAIFHSKTNRIMLKTSSKHLWLIRSFQSKKLVKGCYSLNEGSRVIARNKITSIEGQFYKLIDRKNSSVYYLEKRIIR